MLDGLDCNDKLILGAQQTEQRTHFSLGDEFRLLQTQVSQLLQATEPFREQVGQFFGGELCHDTSVRVALDSRFRTPAC